MVIPLATFIHNLPKCELHVHLEGCLTPPLARILATRNNVPLPASISVASDKDDDKDDGTVADTQTHKFHDLTSFLAIYYPAMTVLHTHQDFHDLAWVYLVKAASQNVRRTEMFFDPQAHTARGVPFTTVLQGYHSATVRAKKELGVSSALILCILRDHSVSSAEDTLTAALDPSNRDLILGIGLDSDERDNPPAKFADVFARARRDGPPHWKLTMHCDIDQPNTLVHIRQALQDIQVDRIDHGTNIVDAPDLVELVRNRGIGLTCCPISNSFVTNDFKGKEMVALLRQGVKVSVHSDDPAYFGGYLEENLVKMAHETEIGWRGCVQLCRNAFEIAWIDDDDDNDSAERRKWLMELDEWEARANSEGVS